MDSDQLFINKELLLYDSGQVPLQRLLGGAGSEAGSYSRLIDLLVPLNSRLESNEEEEEEGSGSGHNARVTPRAQSEFCTAQKAALQMARLNPGGRVPQGNAEVVDESVLDLCSTHLLVTYYSRA